MTLSGSHLWMNLEVEDKADMPCVYNHGRNQSVWLGNRISIVIVTRNLSRLRQTWDSRHLGAFYTLFKSWGFQDRGRPRVRPHWDEPDLDSLMSPGKFGPQQICNTEGHQSSQLSVLYEIVGPLPQQLLARLEGHLVNLGCQQRNDTDQPWMTEAIIW